MANAPSNPQNQAGRRVPGTGARDGMKPAPASPSVPGAPAPDILAGPHAFSRRSAEEQGARERAEAERRRGEEEETRRKIEAERVRQAQAEAQRKAGAEKQSEGRRFAALDMLRKQAAGRPAGEDTASRRAAAKARLQPNLPPPMD